MAFIRTIMGDITQKNLEYVMHMNIYFVQADQKWIMIKILNWMIMKHL